MIKKIVILILLSTVLAAVDDIWQGVVTAKYEITGRNVTDLRESIRVLGPENDGGRYAALTIWNISVKYPFGTGRAAVDVSIRVIIPTADRSKMDNGVAEKWDSFYLALIKHEEKHVEIARKCRGEIDKTINAYSSDRHERIVSDIVSKWKLKEREMDKMTEQGKAEGVVIQ